VGEQTPVQSDRLLWIVISALGLTVVALALRHQQGTIAGLDLETFASFAYLSALFVLVAGLSYAFFYSRLGEMLRAALFWLVIVLLLALGYSYRYELEGVSQRVLSELLISRPANLPGQNATVQVARARGGDFSVRAEVNGARVQMLVDTGASSVVLTPQAARAAGLPVDLLKYDVPIETASGRARAAAVVLDRIAVGSIVERRVPALVSAPDGLRTSLLGMSFLNRLDSFEVRGGQLVMRAKQAAR
jgi:aspartyl protease family protein